MIAEYKYLVATLLGLLPLGLALCFAGRLRNTAIVCGVVLSAYSPPVAWLYERVYWTPGRLFGGGFGIEDILFCFHAGAVSWLCAMAPWRARARLTPALRTAARRLLSISLVAVSVLLLLVGSGVGIVAAFLLTQTISTALILIARPSYLRLVASVAPIFMTYYFMTLGIWRLLMPGFMDMWRGTELTGWKLLGVPVEEYLWVLSFSTGFTITMAFAFDVRFGSGLAFSGEKRPA